MAVSGKSRAALVVLGIAVVGGGAALFYPKAPAGPEAASRGVVIRRLDQEQYRLAIADIFGPAIKVGGRFEPDLREEGLVAVGAGRVSVTATGLEQYDKMARSVAEQVVSERQRAALISCQPADAKAADDACAKQFLGDAGRLLYRRPLSESELASRVAVAHAAADKLGGFYPGLSTALTTLLVSPNFLFRQQHVEPDPDHPGQWRLDAYSKATQLSYFLWNAAPDPELLDAAASGQLHTSKGLQAQVDRMLGSPRIEAGVRAFFADMLGFDGFKTLAKDAALFPKFTFKVAADAQEQTLRTITDHLLTRKGDYRDLFTTRDTFLSPMLASVYGVPLDSDGAWVPYSFAKDDKRAGILTQVSFLSLHGHPGRSSPTLRGKALREVLLCQTVPVPPANVNFTLVQDTANPTYKTARARLGAHATDPTCAGCHKIIDPIGLAMENFDSSGGWRQTENDTAIDTTGDLDGRGFANPVGLGQAVHDNPAAPACLVRRLYAYAIGAVPAKPEGEWLTTIEGEFAAKGYRLTDLLRRIATSDALYQVQGPNAAAAAPQTASLEAQP